MSTLAQIANNDVPVTPAAQVALGGVGESTVTTVNVDPQTTTANVATAALKGLNEAGTSDNEGVVAKQKAIEVSIAERAAKRATKKATEQALAEGHKRAGDILLQSNNYKAAVTQYQEALNLCRNNVGYYISLAAAYRKLAWYEEAAHNATQALILEPTNTEARYIRGVARLEQRLLNPAKIDFETVLQHDPSHFLARNALVEVTAFIAASTHIGDHELGNNPVEELTKDVDFGFPHLDYEPLEIASVSDSSDCNHVGNGVPCRFYNHDGCARGTLCAFSHAPDEKSVRDELGRNVCIYHLLDSCKFGEGRCVYSHSKSALPKRGWWSSPEQIAKVKSVMEVTEKKAKEARHTESEQWKAHMKTLKSQRQSKRQGAGNADDQHPPAPAAKKVAHHNEKAHHHEKAQPKKAGQGKKIKSEVKTQGDKLSQVGNANAEDESGSKGKDTVSEAVGAELVSTTSAEDYLKAYYAVKPTSAAEYLNAYYNRSAA